MAVTTTMVITTLLAFVVPRAWGWGLGRALLVTASSSPSTSRSSARRHKIEHGGWFPLLVALIATQS
jgi:K+ transporter